MSGHTNRTLVFCTAWSPDAPGHYNHWETRYRRWLDAIKASQLKYDAILMVDDASASLPCWPDLETVREGGTARRDKPAELYSFAQHLGRHAISDFPGWVRSFGYAALHAERHGFTKVVHIESDAFLISERMQQHVNQIEDGWVAFWCPLYQRAESGIQVIAGRQLAKYVEIAKQDIGILATSVVEDTLPFTHVEKSFVGDRYGERGFEVPREADYAMQTFPSRWVDSKDFYWWMNEMKQAVTKSQVGERYRKDIMTLQHVGLNYQAVMEVLSAVIAPRTYFEIGSKNGHSMMKFSCDSLCVDPNLQLDAGVIGRKPRVFLFQMTSDAFFEQEGIRKYFPAGPDLGFLDGLHLAEYLLRDFMNFEKASHGKSVAILHDCLPTNTRMAEREIRRGGPDEPEAQREFWTGDVWKVLLALLKYRPDLNVFFLDSPPTGLVVITNLDRMNRELDANYQSIVGELFNEDLARFTIERLWALYPTLSSAALCQNGEDLQNVLGL